MTTTGPAAAVDSALPISVRTFYRLTECQSTDDLADTLVTYLLAAKSDLLDLSIASITLTADIIEGAANRAGVPANSIRPLPHGDAKTMAASEMLIHQLAGDYDVVQACLQQFVTIHGRTGMLDLISALATTARRTLASSRDAVWCTVTGTKTLVLPGGQISGACSLCGATDHTPATGDAA